MYLYIRYSDWEINRKGKKIEKELERTKVEK